ncbi:MAG: DNAase [Candidatus Accumulibacter sp. 66-26]|nr:TatD family hydrolase [Accumulibacter sp.]OJW48877.1 MAG: DNAase [Candidatus Accumulibacter sp. 66-26]
MLIDTHCHLDAAEFAADRAAVAQAARVAGVEGIVVPAIETANFAAVRECCARYPGCAPAYGIHPLYVGRASEADLDTLRDWLRREADGPWPPVAVGEIGLDFFVPDADPARQEFFFVEQLKIARDFGLPVLLHVRRAQDAILKQLRRVFGKTHGYGGVAHAFNGSRQQADAFIALGFKLGFGGTLTFPRALRIRELAATLPLDAIVLETDAPDIPPAFLGRARNAPQHLPRIAAELAGLRGLAVEDVAQATSRNARAVLPRLSATA